VQINTDQLADNLCIAYLAAQLDITIATAAKQYKSLGTTGTYWKAMAQYLYQQNEVQLFEVREAQGETLPLTDPLPLYLRLAWKATLDNVTMQTAQKRYGKDPIGPFWISIAESTVTDLSPTEHDSINDNGEEVVIYDRRPFTPWIIEVIKDEDGLWEEYEAIYRTTMRDGRECEQFTVLETDSDYAPVQIQIFKNDEVNVCAFEAAFVTIKRRPKRIISIRFILDEDRMATELLAEEASMNQMVLKLMEERAAQGQPAGRLANEWVRFSSTIEGEQDEQLANDPFLRACFYSGAFALSKLNFDLARESPDEDAYQKAMNGVLAELNEFTDAFASNRDTDNPLDPIHRSAGIDNAAPGERVTPNPITKKELESILNNPRFEPLADNLFIAYVADRNASSIEEAEELFGVLLSHREENRLGEFWYSLAAMVEQQMRMHATGEKLLSLHEDRLDTYEDGDPLPRYLLAAYTAFEQSISLPEYSLLIGGINTEGEIGNYWRWVAQKIRREFVFLDADQRLDSDADRDH
jgi:hypothetical protein